MLVEGGCWTLSEVDPIDLVGLLIVASHHGGAGHRILDRLLAILATLLGLVTEVVQIVQAVVCPDYLETDVDVEKDACLLHGESRIKTWPHLDVMGVQVVGISLVEALLADSLELERAHHRVEEDLQKVHVVLVSLLHDLDPLDGHSVGHTVMLSRVDGQLWHFLEREDAEAVVNVELELLLDLIAALLEDLLAKGSRIVRDLRLKLHGVLVHTLHVVGVEVDREVVRVELQRLPFCVAGTLGLLREESSRSCSCCGYHVL